MLTTINQQQHIVVALNGAFRFPDRLRPIVDQADTLIACDGGATWLYGQGYSPDYLIGDMDSVSAQALLAAKTSECIIESYPAAKDETDGELGLRKAAQLGATRITLIGALGGRIDHELANLMLLCMAEVAHIPITIFDGQSYLALITSSTTIHGSPGDTLSLIPWSASVEGISTSNLEYPLDDEPLSMGPARGVSNVMLAHSATISLRAGRLLVIHTPLAHQSTND